MLFSLVIGGSQIGATDLTLAVDYDNSSFDIVSVPVSSTTEPSTVVFVGAGLVAMTRAIRRKYRNQCALSAPEPNSKCGRLP